MKKDFIIGILCGLAYHLYTLVEKNRRDIVDLQTGIIIDDSIELVETKCDLCGETFQISDEMSKAQCPHCKHWNELERV